MANYNFFIDIERFVQWINTNSHLFGEDIKNEFSLKTYKNWRKYSKFPSLKSLEKINTKITGSSEDKFQTINIAELIICINNAKDHNRGNNSSLRSISSTEKKILIILLLGRSLNDSDSNCFIVNNTNNKEAPLYEYLTAINPNSKNSSKIETFNYFPGRTFSFQQLCNLSLHYKNGITKTGIKDGLEKLVDTGFISCINKKNLLYRLEFKACRDFLESCKN